MPPPRPRCCASTFAARSAASRPSWRRNTPRRPQVAARAEPRTRGQERHGMATHPATGEARQATAQTYDVGGVKLARPFRIRRLGHFGINVHDPEVSRVFYEDLLGLRVTDRLDLTGRLPEEELVKHGPRIGYFTRCNAEHHSFVFFPRRAL